MLLVLNVGNTAISAGAFAGEELRFVAQTATRKGATAFDLALHIRQTLALAGGGEEPFSGAILSCVVPSLRQAAAEAADLLVRPGGRRLVLGPGVKTGLDIRTQNPAATGSDLVALAVGALTLAGGPCAAFSLGTATAAVALGEGGALRGTAVMPGLALSLEALRERAACLPEIALEGGFAPPLGSDTVGAMRGGLLHGHAAMLDEMAERLQEALGTDCPLYLCGRWAALVQPYCRAPFLLKEHLLLRGLAAIYRKNTAERQRGE